MALESWIIGSSTHLKGTEGGTPVTVSFSRSAETGGGCPQGGWDRQLSPSSQLAQAGILTGQGSSQDAAWGASSRLSLLPLPRPGVDRAVLCPELCGSQADWAGRLGENLRGQRG